MPTQTIEPLTRRHCKPCEGGVEKFSVAQAEEQLKALGGWKLLDEARQLRKDWRAKNFLAGVDFFRDVAELAEREDHHPDLHLEGYRHVSIVLSTHAVGGLSENDFILAAKIDELAEAARLGEWKS